MYFKVVAVNSEEELKQVTDVLEREGLEVRVESYFRLAAEEIAEAYVTETPSFMRLSGELVTEFRDDELEALAIELEEVMPEDNTAADVIHSWARQQGWKLQ